MLLDLNESSYWLYNSRVIYNDFLAIITSFFDENSKFFDKKPSIFDKNDYYNSLCNGNNDNTRDSRVALVSRLDKALPKQKLFRRALLRVGFKWVCSLNILKY